MKKSTPNRLENTLSKSVPWDSPGDPVAKNWPCNAGDKALIPGRGIKITHAKGQLSSRATTRGSTHLN